MSSPLDHEHRDIAAAAERGSELELAAALFQTVFDSSPVGMLLVDADGIVRAANGAFSTMFDATETWPIGSAVTAVLPDPAWVRQLVPRTGGASDDDLSTASFARNTDGVAFPVEISVDTVEAGGIEFMLVFIRDVSHQHEAAKGRADAEAGLQAATELHDAVIQRVFGAGMRLQAAMAMSQTEGVRDQIASAAEGLDDAINELRQAIARQGGLGS